MLNQDAPHPAAHLEGLLQYLPARTVNTLLLQAVTDSCPGCAPEVSEATDSRRSSSSALALASALGIEITDEDLHQYRREAPKLPADRDERLTVIRRATRRFQAPGLVALLLSRSRRELSAASGRALNLAEAAADVAEHGTRDPALTALALAYAGNVHRATGRLDLADPCFDRALAHLSRDPLPPLWLRAEVRSLEGSLLKDHRDFRRARWCLSDAAAMFKATGDRERLVRVRLKIAETLYLQGNSQTALTALQHALDALDPWKHPSLHLAALHNLALYLCAADEHPLADAVLELTAPFYGNEPFIAARRTWLRGVVARGLNDSKTTEEYFRRALQEFLSLDSAFYAALVAVDLSELLLAQGRAAEVVDVTRHLPGLFRSLDVHPEAAAATVLFHRAAQQCRLTEDTLAFLKGFFERAQVDPSAAVSSLPD